jgi:hypothetical protein
MPYDFKVDVTVNGNAIAMGDHDHDGDYTPPGHTHDYASSGHTHPDGNATTLDGIDSTGFATSGHDHDSDYAPLVHAHDDRYPFASKVPVQVQVALEDAPPTGRSMHTLEWSQASIGPTPITVIADGANDVSQALQIDYIVLNNVDVIATGSVNLIPESAYEVLVAGGNANYFLMALWADGHFTVRAAGSSGTYTYEASLWLKWK